MKLVRKDDKAFVFEMVPDEKRLFLDVLKLYPLIPAAHRPAPRTAGAAPPPDNEKLLAEALSERKQANKRQLQKLLSEERPFKTIPTGCLFTLGDSQAEWLLQVVNEIRVGSWLILGEPDEKKGKPIRLNRENARYYAAMEFCDYIEMTLLDAFNRRS